MSFVGPRPVTQQLQAQLERIDPYYRFRLRIVPGITGWGRLLGSPPSDPEKQRIELQRDLFYIRYADLSFDLAITFNAFIRGARELINSLIRTNASHYQSNS